MAKFSPGDPVWVMPGTDDYGVQVVKRETPAVVLSVMHRTMFKRLSPWCSSCGGSTLNEVQTEYHLAVCDCRLRPRRDDYQQHEARGDNKVIDLIRFASKEDIKVPEEPFKVPVDA